MVSTGMEHVLYNLAGLCFKNQSGLCHFIQATCRRSLFDRSRSSFASLRMLYIRAGAKIMDEHSSTSMIFSRAFYIPENHSCVFQNGIPSSVQRFDYFLSPSRDRPNFLY